ncbi:ABC transporter substrate-binding protein [Halanaerobium sp.]|uniref:ABC transporter substrate-binding protein n=1 Tax=Halanaerobium sp. TaxID=1895664 RepID=UPI000DE7BA2D|nr:ABC transporter substrate-binding protein [Halanaerobium sp.]PUU94442.1 MAG: ABC-type sugar transport system, periplasmic component [Halanaerobium sp.]
MSKKLTVSVFLVAVLLLTTGSVLAEEITLDFWNGFTGPDGTGMGKMVEEFNKEHEGEIEVNMQVMQWGTYYQKVVTALSTRSDSSPDIGIMHVDRVPEFASKGVLLDLDQIVADLGWSKDNFANSVWSAGIYEGNRYGIPLDVHPLAMYINKDLFKEAGLDPENPPKTPAEFMNAIAKMTKDTDGDGEIDQWGTAFPPLWPGPEFILPSLLRQFGGSFLNEDRTEVVVDSKESIAALEYAVDIVHNKGYSPKNIQQDGEVTLFRQGRLGIHFNGIWMINGFKDQEGLNFMSYPVPRMGDKLAIAGNSHNFVFFRKPGNSDAEFEAAAEFVKYISNNSVKWAAFGQIPARNSVRNSQAFEALKHQASIAQEVESVVFPPKIPIASRILTPYYEAVNLAILGEKEPAEALKDAAEAGQIALDEYLQTQ